MHFPFLLAAALTLHPAPVPAPGAVMGGPERLITVQTDKSESIKKKQQELERHLLYRKSLMIDYGVDDGNSELILAELGLTVAFQAAQDALKKAEADPTNENWKRAKEASARVKKAAELYRNAFFEAASREKLEDRSEEITRDAQALFFTMINIVECRAQLKALKGK